MNCQKCNKPMTCVIGNYWQCSCEKVEKQTYDPSRVGVKFENNVATGSDPATENAFDMVTEHVDFYFHFGDIRAVACTDYAAYNCLSDSVQYVPYKLSIPDFTVTRLPAGQVRPDIYKRLMAALKFKRSE